LQSGVGFATENIRLAGRRDAALFGEVTSRVVVSVQRDHVGVFEALLDRNEVPFARLGETGGDRLRIANAIDVSLDDLRAAYEGGLEAALTNGGS
jgi:hypothetical protein